MDHCTPARMFTLQEEEAHWSTVEHRNQLYSGSWREMCTSFTMGPLWYYAHHQSYQSAFNCKMQHILWGTWISIKLFVQYLDIVKRGKKTKFYWTNHSRSQEKFVSGAQIPQHQNMCLYILLFLVSFINFYT